MGDSLIDLKALSEPAVKLIEKISDAIGILYNPTRIRREAKAIADANIIKRINENTLSEIDKRIANRLWIKETKRQNNIETIISQSLKELKSDNKIDQLNEDWITEFFNLSQDCSDNNLQFVWSKLLNSEVDKPGSVSRRLLHIIKILSAEEANWFQKIANCIWEVKYIDLDNQITYNAICNVKDDEYYSLDSWDLTTKQVYSLISCGLITDDEIYLQKDLNYEFKYQSEIRKLNISKKDEMVQVFTLLDSGIELYQIINKNFNNKYFEESISFFERKNFKY